jgi:pyruvate carboxylase subunit A
MPTNYDSMIGKLIVWALDWEGVVKKAKRALDEYYIEGLTTNIPLHKEVVCDESFQKGIFDTGFLDKRVEHFALINTIAPTEDKRITSFISKLMQKGLTSKKGDFI